MVCSLRAGGEGVCERPMGSQGAWRSQRGHPSSPSLRSHPGKLPGLREGSHYASKGGDQNWSGN